MKRNRKTAAPARPHPAFFAPLPDSLLLLHAPAPPAHYSTDARTEMQQAYWEVAWFLMESSLNPSGERSTATKLQESAGTLPSTEKKKRRGFKTTQEQEQQCNKESKPETSLRGKAFLRTENFHPEPDKEAENQCIEEKR